MSINSSKAEPTTVTIGCVPSAHPSYNDPGVPRTTLSIVDPDGFFAPYELTCGFGEQLRLTIEGAAGEQFGEVVRRVPGVLSSDVVHVRTIQTRLDTRLSSSSCPAMARVLRG